MTTTVTPETETAPTAADAPAYRIVGVTKTYRQKNRQVQPLTGVDLVIDKGDFVTLQGPTGGGKSTFLQILGTLDRPTTGEIWLNGREISKASNRELEQLRAHEIGFVFPGFNLIPTLTAAENVDMGLEPLGLPKEERARRVADALSRVGLADRGEHLPSELSGGQQQRVAIARAIAKQPQVLLADEPTGNLDERMRDEILQVLQSLNDEGLTLVVVTHNSAVAKRAKRRLRLKKGTVRDITNKK